MKFVGIMLLLVASGAFVFEYTQRIKKGIWEYCETSRFFEYAVRELSKSKSSPSNIVLSYKRQRKEATAPWIDSIISHTGEGITPVIDREGKIDLSSSALCGEDKETIEKFFKEFGRGLADCELSRLSETASHFTKRAKRAAEEGERRIKVALLLLTSSFLGAFILML